MWGGLQGSKSRNGINYASLGSWRFMVNREMTKIGHNLGLNQDTRPHFGDTLSLLLAIVIVQGLTTQTWWKHKRSFVHIQYIFYLCAKLSLEHFLADGNESGIRLCKVDIDLWFIQKRDDRMKPRVHKSNFLLHEIMNYSYLLMVSRLVGQILSN